MTQKMYIEVEFLRPGMTIAEDIFYKGLLFIPKNVSLSENLIINLKKYSFKQALIYIEHHEPMKNLKHTYNLTIALIKNFLLDFKDFRSVNMEIIDEIVFQVSQSQNKYKLFELAHEMQSKDEYTYNHSLSVALLTLMLGDWVGYKPHSNLILAGLLHDVGKLDIDEKILGKPGPLTPEEWIIVKEHSLNSAKFIRANDQFATEVINGALYHHERQDGSGYPYGLSGNAIPPIARIISICDVFDAMTSRRPYKNGEDIFRVLQYLYSCKHLFDWQYLETFVFTMLELLTGENVLLSTGQHGKLIFINRFSPFKPLVKVGSHYLDLATEDIQIESVASAK